MMQDGINLDTNVLIQVLQNKLAQAAIREAQMEAAVQQQQAEIDRLDKLVPKDTEVTEDGIQSSNR